MDALQFLTRVVAPGAYYAFAYKHPGSSGLRHQFFPQTDLRAAVDWLRHTANTCDVWHAVASFKTSGSRKQSNAENLRCFWYDADIKRDGDGKAPEATWVNIQELMAWLGANRDRLPVPNLWITSGYGVHLYWVLDTSIPADEWKTHAQKFRDLLRNLGARGDIGISTDSARVLRPPETLNFKVPSNPQATKDLTPVQIRTANFVTKDFLALLTLGVSQPKLGPSPGKKVSTKSLIAAKSNLPKPPPADFNTVASNCLQVRKSLDEEGEHDRYPLWHLLTNLAYFCDNREAAHDLGRKGINYSPADTDAKFDKTTQEHGDKQSFGAPSCVSINDARPGVCTSCPHWTKINSPYSLGWSGDLPTNYMQTERGVAKDDTILAGGIASNPQLFLIGAEYQLVFDYTFGGRTFPVRINESQLSTQVDKTRKLFGGQGISLHRSAALPFSDFIMAWITELKDARRAIAAPPSFGWVRDDDGGYLGMSVAGIFYRTDGTQSLAQPGDKTIRENYAPKGDIKTWRKACEYVIADRPELHTIVAASFAAPLMELVGESGILSVWSRLSGARKTSAFRAGTAVWCNPIVGMSAIKDTTYSVQQSLGETRIMPVYWDEIHTANKEQVTSMVDMIFNVTQGRGRARLDQKIEQRAVAQWRTLLVLSSNRPNAEIIEQDRGHTNAGTLRLFEYAVEPHGSADPEAMEIVQSLERNCGHAGREFAQWVITHVDDVRKTIKRVRTDLYRDIPDIRPEERFHIATIVGIVSGAAIATMLKIVSLDCRAIYKFLMNKLREIRAGNQAENPSQDENKSLSVIFERFVADNTDSILVTQSFAAAGRPTRGLANDRVKLVHQPPIKCTRALIHISLDDRELRFDHNAFKQWCFKNGQSHTAMFEMLERLWSTKKVRAVLAIGTDWSSGGNVYYHKLILGTPELEHHLKWGTPAPASNVVPFPPAAQ